MQALILAGAYLLAAEVGSALSAPGGFATFWPPSGLLLSALVLAPRSRWLRAVLVVLPANLAFDLLHGRSAALSVAYWAGNAVAALVGAWLVTRFVGTDVTFTRVRDVMRFAVVAAFGGTMLGATIGAAATVAAHGGSYLESWRTWWLGDLLGLLVVAPVILAWARDDGGAVEHRRVAEWAALGGVVVIVTLLLGLRASLAPERLPAAPMVVFPLLGWAVWKFGPRGTSIVLLAVSLVALWNHQRGQGLFAAGTASARSAAEVEAFLSVAVVTFLAIAAVIRELASLNVELTEARRAAQDASRLKSEFLATMSHEVRTPLTAIVGYAQLITDHGAIPDDVRAWAGNVSRSGDHLMGIVNEILDLSKIEAGKLTVERVSCAPVAILAEVTSLMRVQAVRKGLAFGVRYESVMPEGIVTDPMRLRQILLNLVSNAIKFTETGEVRVRARMTTGVKPMLRVEVADTGIGMPPAVQARLGTAFNQAERAGHRGSAGTGLGLAIAKRLTEILGGSLTVHSVSGEGSTVVVTIDPGPLDGVPVHDLPAGGPVANGPPARRAG